MKEALQEFERLLDIMDKLRKNCPWDKKQTFETLRNLTIEETYELADAIINKDMNKIKEELGDILLHIVFYSKIASETKDFDIKDVLNNICEKLIRRHPHIFGDVKVKDDEEVKRNWEKIKRSETDSSVLNGIPNSLPAMIKAHRIQEKAHNIGFDWENSEQVWEKVNEELKELKNVVDKKDKEKITDEFGDLLFSLINYARFIGVEPEIALEMTNKKFIKRFQYLEQEAKKTGKSLSKMSLNEMDEFWNKAKDIK